MDDQKREPGFETLADMRRATALVEMRREAQEFSWRRPATPLAPISASLPACNGTGHAGAI
jgi:hypothetical protein